MRSALLFDLDGTIVDSDPDHLRAFKRVFAAHGVALDRESYVNGVMGASNDVIGEKYLGHLSLLERSETLERKEKVYRDGLGELTATEGLAALLDFADSRRLKRALVTNAPRANVLKVLDALGLSDRFAHRIIGAELAQAKPHPLPYLTALERLGADANRSVAFEDSFSGLRSALAAGLATVAVTTSLKASALLAAGASLAVKDFTDPRIRPFIEARARA